MVKERVRAAIRRGWRSLSGRRVEVVVRVRERSAAAVVVGTDRAPRSSEVRVVARGSDRRSILTSTSVVAGVLDLCVRDSMWLLVPNFPMLQMLSLPRAPPNLSETFGCGCYLHLGSSASGSSLQAAALLFSRAQTWFLIGGLEHHYCAAKAY